MTEGWAEIGDGKTTLRIEVDRAVAPLLGMLTHRVSGGKLFCQIQLSALELDDTRKPEIYRPGARRFRFSISASLAKNQTGDAPRHRPPIHVPPKDSPYAPGWTPPSGSRPTYQKPGSGRTRFMPRPPLPEAS